MSANFIYRWCGEAYGSFSVWGVLRETPKCLFLQEIRDADARYLSSEFRLNKKDLDVPSEYWGIKWASDPQILIDQIDQEVLKETARRAEFDTQVLNAMCVLQDALT